MFDIAVVNNCFFGFKISHQIYWINFKVVLFLRYEVSFQRFKTFKALKPSFIQNHERLYQTLYAYKMIELAI